MTDARTESLRNAAERFTRETEHHKLEVLHDDGLYRHLKFKQPGNSAYWFDLITVPGALIFQGDGDSYVFRRIQDMFEFFRGPVGRINPVYWSEKLTDGRARVKVYQQELFEQLVKELFVESVKSGDWPRGLGMAVREEILDNWEIGDENGAHRALANFEFNGFHFADTYELDFRDFDWWFLWACHAIVFGIAQYDAARVPAEAVSV